MKQEQTHENWIQIKHEQKKMHNPNYPLSKKSYPGFRNSKNDWNEFKLKVRLEFPQENPTLENSGITQKEKWVGA